MSLLESNPWGAARRQRLRRARAGHALALKTAIDAAVRGSEAFRIGAFLLGRGVGHDTWVRRDFRDTYGATPSAYYLAQVIARVGELRAATPGIKRAWLVLYTGATEGMIAKALARRAA